MTEAVRGEFRESGFVNEIHWCGTCDFCRKLMARAREDYDRERVAAYDFVESMSLATDSLVSSGSAPSKTLRWNMVAQRKDPRPGDYRPCRCRR